MRGWGSPPPPGRAVLVVQSSLVWFGPLRPSRKVFPGPFVAGLPGLDSVNQPTPKPNLGWVFKLWHRGQGPNFPSMCPAPGPRLSRRAPSPAPTWPSPPEARERQEAGEPGSHGGLCLEPLLGSQEARARGVGCGELEGWGACDMGQEGADPPGTPEGSGLEPGGPKGSLGPGQSSPRGLCWCWGRPGPSACVFPAVVEGAGGSGGSALWSGVSLCCNYP